MSLTQTLELKEGTPAVLASADDREVLYFVARMDGSSRHVFAKTLAEHNANVRRFLQGR